MTRYYGPIVDGTTDHVFKIPMPWSGRYYSINTDEFAKGRRLLVIAWFFENRCFFLRMGWTFHFKPRTFVETYSTLPHSERFE